jgi:putative membrane protein
MKKLIYLLTISAAVLSFPGCSNSANNDADGNDTSAMATDTSMVTDTTMATDLPKKDTGLSDTAFATKAAIGGMAEVELGQLALQKAKDSKVKNFAAMMVKDHSKANQELMAIAKAKNITLPTSLDQEHKNKLEELKSKSGADFDKAYTKAMVEGHEKTLALMQEGIDSLTDPELKGFAAKTSPVVQHHLQLINSIKMELK